MKIRVIDFETTGDAPPDAGVCEIGWCDLTASEFDLLDAPTAWDIGYPELMLVDPGMPIPPITSAIHHIIDEDVAGRSDWRSALKDVLPAPNDSEFVALAAHSAKFERLFCTNEFTLLPWLCTYKAALRLWPDAPSHSNQCLRYWRKPLGLNRDRAAASHRAGPDAYVTAFHLRDQLELVASQGKAAIEVLDEWSNKPALQIICHIGKNTRGMKWRDVDDGFLYWCRNKDFDEDVLFTVETEIARRESELREYAEAAPEEVVG